ncbi:hypothetical protein B0T20DRAFT_364876 [Sordaria brevicollis]|uniref:Uncharacterized protein n=1 Tax=Sordaria brevicollis TaxID=83679 RepID=A0AAE0NVR6_SORBR|nr:hypothetical protein B0T20DRAFT_364876 [Sordaria brevicollis]
MSTNHTELVNALKDINNTLAAQTEHLKTNSLLLQALLELSQKEAGKTPSTFEPNNEETSSQSQDVHTNVQQDSNKLIQPGETNSLLYAEPSPDLIPAWEVLEEMDLRKFTVLCPDEQSHFHIDDHKFTTPRNHDRPSYRSYGKWRDVGDHYVPYSFSTTRRRETSTYKGREGAETTGLGEYADVLVNVLNNLYSIPTDARLPLGFEPLSLRRKKCKDELDEYLISSAGFVEKLHSAGGTFIIWDYDVFGNRFCYYPSDMMWSHRDKLFDLFPVTHHSIAWHRNNENRRVDRYYKLIPNDIYDEFFFLLTNDKHWYATDWAACARKWLRVEAHFDSTLEPQTTRPWYRILDFNGLERIDGLDVADQFVNFLLSKSTPGAATEFDETGLSLGDHLQIAVTQHLKADPLWGTAITAKGQWDTFHISWYRVPSKPYKSCWGYGPLYIEEGYFLSRQSFSITLYCSNYDTGDTTTGTATYWTMLETGDTFWYSSANLRAGILEFIHRALTRAAKEWAELDLYFDRLDAKRELIFNPEQHDSLLFDDRHFSRSRLYFWAINSLGRFIQDINVTIERWERFWEENKGDIYNSEQHLLDKHAKANETEPRIGEQSVEELHASILLRIQSLKNTRQGFESRRQKIIEYRDGLFNASSVIETREATRLSQNVKLLTFVSIFYLPLGFCMSMWSINEDYNTTNLVVVTICIGLATYAVVANLETTVHALQRGVSLLFNTPRKRLIKKMMDESDTRWRSLGEEMSKAPLSREDAKPSEWLIFGYWCTTIYHSLKSLRRTKQERVVEQAKPTEAPPERWLASIYQMLQSIQQEKRAVYPQPNTREDMEARLQWRAEMWARMREKLDRTLIQAFQAQNSGKAKGAEQTVSQTLPYHAIMILPHPTRIHSNPFSYELPISNTHTSSQSTKEKDTSIQDV